MNEERLDKLDSKTREAIKFWEINPLPCTSFQFIPIVTGTGQVALIRKDG